MTILYLQTKANQSAPFKARVNQNSLCLLWNIYEKINNSVENKENINNSNLVKENINQSLINKINNSTDQDDNRNLINNINFNKNIIDSKDQNILKDNDIKTRNYDDVILNSNLLTEGKNFRLFRKESTNER